MSSQHAVARAAAARQDRRRGSVSYSSASISQACTQQTTWLVVSSVISMMLPFLMSVAVFSWHGKGYHFLFLVFEFECVFQHLRFRGGGDVLGRRRLTVAHAATF